MGMGMGMGTTIRVSIAEQRGERERRIVGHYKSDLLVNHRVIVELKVAEKYDSPDEGQLLNELKATGIKVGLLIDFGRHKAEFKRCVY